MKTDLDALERVVREMTAGEWEDDGVAIWNANNHYVAATFGGVDRVGIVALRNAAESLIGELRAAREVVEAAEIIAEYQPFDVDHGKLGAALDAALAAYQTGVGELTVNVAPAPTTEVARLEVQP